MSGFGFADVSRLNLVARVLATNREKGEVLLVSLVSEWPSPLLASLLSSVHSDCGLRDISEALLSSSVHEERLAGRALGEALKGMEVRSGRS